jgi:CRP/FNR family cyclic AMP-dependent transcriptional regulator
MRIIGSELWRRPYASRLPVFSSLLTSELSTLNGLGKQILVRPLREVFGQDEPAKHIYRVVDGRINLITTSGSGRVYLVRVLYAGDVLGMSAVLSGVPYEASAIASTLSVFCRVPAQAFLQFVAGNPGAIACVANALSEEYLDVAEHAKLLQLGGNTESRVARVLLGCAPGDDCGQFFPFIFTHEELGNMAGCSRESVTRTLGTFRRNRFIDAQSHSLKILDPEHLSVIAGLN